MKKLVKELARIEASSICRQQFANVFADCFCAVHTHQLEFANFSLPCEGRFTIQILTQSSPDVYTVEPSPRGFWAQRSLGSKLRKVIET